jgi:hypothetical protein
MKFNISTVKADDLPQSTVEIPNSTIGWATFIVSSIQILATMLGNFLTGTNKNHIDQELNQLKTQNFKVQLLQRVLENEDSMYRAQSLLLLIDAGLMEDPKDKIAKICQDPKKVPRWVTRPLEPLNGGAVTGPRISDNTRISPAPAKTDTGNLCLPGIKKPGQ